MSNKTTNKSVIERYQSRIIPIVVKNIAGEKVEIYLFGSRALGHAHETSDIDIAIKGTDLSDVCIAKIREDLHESRIPYKIDLVNWNRASTSLKENIDKEGILIWQN